MRIENQRGVLVGAIFGSSLKCVPDFACQSVHACSRLTFGAPTLQLMRVSFDLAAARAGAAGASVSSAELVVGRGSVGAIEAEG